jgi:hypothetical protein
MKRRVLMAFTTAGVCATLALTGGVLLRDGVRAGDSVAASQPDTSSPNWKELSGDVGVMIRDDGRLGLRGRLYVRVDGVWYPVATDGPADVHTTVPVK